VKTDQSLVARVPTILFFVTGVFWAGIIVDGGGSLLVWAILTCFASGAFLMLWATSWFTRPLVAASALFGVVLTIYQLYLALVTLGSGLPGLAIVSAPLFAVFTVIYLYLFYACTWPKEE
jgi:hypothetical protein